MSNLIALITHSYNINRLTTDSMLIDGSEKQKFYPLKVTMMYDVVTDEFIIKYSNTSFRMKIIRDNQLRTEVEHFEENTSFNEEKYLQKLADDLKNTKEVNIGG